MHVGTLVLPTTSLAALAQLWLVLHIGMVDLPAPLRAALCISWLVSHAVAPSPDVKDDTDIQGLCA